jgi:hypothetical protein
MPTPPPPKPPPQSGDCHQKYAGIRFEKEIIVNVSDDSSPIVLALTAYDKTHWKVSLRGGARLAKVILAGYHSQRVSGIPPDTPIEGPATGAGKVQSISTRTRTLPHN